MSNDVPDLTGTGPDDVDPPEPNRPEDDDTLGPDDDPNVGDVDPDKHDVDVQPEGDDDEDDGDSN